MNILKKPRRVISFLILAVVLGLFLWLSILRYDLLEQNKLAILAFFLAVMALGFATLLSLRTTLLYNSRMADINMYSYALQAETSLDQQTNTYREIAKKWREFSKDYRYSAKLRAYSAASCFWGLIALFITFPLALLLTECLYLCWVIFFAISFGFLVWALLIHVFQLDCPCLTKLLSLSKFPILEAELPAQNEFIKETVEKYAWLRDC